MILKPDWKQQLYDRARDEVENNKPHKSEYITVYGQMRSKGIENYEIEDMDVTLISGLISGNAPFLEGISKKTFAALHKVRGDRNTTDHSGEKENEEVLYRRAWSDLNNLKTFVEMIDEEELSIDNTDRLIFREKYISKIDSLQELLDRERIHNVQQKKEIEGYIKEIKESNDPLREWNDIHSLLLKNFKKNRDKYNEFVVSASDSGIAYAHQFALIYYIMREKDYAEAEKRLWKIYESLDELKESGVMEIVDGINLYLQYDNKLTDGIRDLISKTKEKGYIIVENTDGFFELNNKTKI